MNTGADPGGISGITGTRNEDGSYNFEKMQSAIIADVEKMGRSIRVIDGPNALIYENEYRIAFRVGLDPLCFDDPTHMSYDYHFMVQTATGQWADKHGTTSIIALHPYGMTPNVILWEMYNIDNSHYGYYNSAIVYFAITRW